MPHTHSNKPLVYTIKELCRVCYTCVRECPAKAIRIINGQAEVINDRCIGCGNCIKVCSQDAKVFHLTRLEVKELLKSGQKVAAIVAPSFPAEFTEYTDHKVFVGMLKKLGFDFVFEVAFGADLVARQYKNLLQVKNGKGFISSDCPAIVNYVKYHHPGLVDNLAPIVSPMVAMSRVVKQKLGNDIKIVFIGPCIAKKAESIEVNYGLTFRELRGMFDHAEISHNTIEPSDFDQPKAWKGAIFPVSRGLSQTVNLSDDLMEGNVIVAEGRRGFQEAIKEFEEDLLNNRHLELLCCEGCIMGPGMSVGGKRFERRTYINAYVKHKITSDEEALWKKNIEDYKNLDLSQSFEPEDKRLPRPSEDDINRVLVSMGKFSPRDHLNCGACGYDTCLEHVIAIVEGLAEIEMCLPNTIEELHESINDLAISNEKLASVQQALKHSEKLAHMGQLSAGIAHELNNPLGVVLMYSNILLDEVQHDNPLRADIELITSQAERCKKIVSGLLNFARKNQLRTEEVDIVKFVGNSLTSVVVPNNVSIETIYESTEIKAHIDYEQMMQALTNLHKNAFEAMPEGGKLQVEVREDENEITFLVKDNGIGIPEENMDKLFTPFFTTKELGKGTGLGLATIYGIVKMHNGRIEVESNIHKEKGPTGTTFRIIIPKDIGQKVEKK